MKPKGNLNNKRYKKNEMESIKNLYNAREEIIKSYYGCSLLICNAAYDTKHGEEFKVLTPK